MRNSSPTRHVRIFRNGRNQAIRIPREFELPGNDALLRQDEQGRLIIESVRTRDLLTLLSAWTPLDTSDSMPSIKDLPAEPVEL